MSEDLHRLVYYSHNRGGASPEAMAVTIERILASSRRNNPRVAVTGALLFNAGCFAQVLEGPKTGVVHTFERIQQDERHSDVLVLNFGPVAERRFGCWSMGFLGDSTKDTQRYGDIAGDSGYDPSCMTGDALLETLQRLVLEEENVPAQQGR